jgi:succinate dehydrogenase hydrophobic anchor subunit
VKLQASHVSFNCFNLLELKEEVWKNTAIHSSLNFSFWEYSLYYLIRKTIRGCKIFVLSSHFCFYFRDDLTSIWKILVKILNILRDEFVLTLTILVFTSREFSSMEGIRFLSRKYHTGLHLKFLLHSMFYLFQIGFLHVSVSGVHFIIATSQVQITACACSQTIILAHTPCLNYKYYCYYIHFI